MKTKKSNSSGMLIALITLLLVIAVVSFIGWVVLKPEPIVLQGQAEANETRVSGKVPGRIEHLLVSEGMSVKKGDTLATLGSPELKAKWEQASYAEDAAAAQSKKARKGARVEQITAAYEVWQKAEVGVRLAESTFNRVQNMYKAGVIALQKKDEADANYQAAVATSKAAKSQYDMAVNGAETEDKLAAEAMVNRAKGAVHEIESYMHETSLIALIDGEISDIFPKEGELLGTGAPLLSILDMTDVNSIFNIREDLLNKIKMGTEFTARIPALGNQEFRFKVYYIKPLASYATFKATKANGGFDVKTFEIRAKPVKEIQGLRPGMTLLVEYDKL